MRSRRPMSARLPAPRRAPPDPRERGDFSPSATATDRSPTCFITCENSTASSLTSRGRTESNGASSGRLHAIRLLVGIQQRHRNCEAEYLRDPLPPFNNIAIAASRSLSRDLLQCVEACLLLGGEAEVGVLQR